jgi:hypothetical protein
MTIKEPLAEPVEEIRPPLSTKAKLVACFALAVFFFASLEILFRIVFPVPKVLNFNRIDYSKMASIHARKKKRGSHYMGNASYDWQSLPDNATSLHTLNLYGFRARDWDFSSPDHERVLFIGDSFVEGVLTPPEKTISRIFEKEAADNGHILETINLGINGIGPIQYARLIRDATPLFKPDKIVVAFFGNDFPVEDLEEDIFANSFTPEFSNPFAPRTIQIALNYAKHRTVAFRWTAPPFGYTPPLNGPYHPIALDPLYQMTAFDGDLLTQANLGKCNAWVFNDLSDTALRLQKPSNADKTIQGISRFLKDRKIELFAVYIPSKYQVNDTYTSKALTNNDRQDIQSFLGDSYQRHAGELRIICDDLSIPFLDLTPELRRLEAEGISNYWDFDLHMRPEGYTRVGKSIYAFVNE